ncbi:MAG: primosomal protein N', partial [Candidatus Cloacimonetes bacterium]|nr:primosomal protein N' [Candidatus Cloacimonadota bacterium]
LYSMLPAVLQPEIDTTVRWIGLHEPQDELQISLHNLIKDGGRHKVSALKSSLPQNYPLYKQIEIAEISGFIEVIRSYSSKIKPRTVNYIVPASEYSAAVELTVKQREVLDVIYQAEPPVPMAEIAGRVSYSLIKTLVKKGLIRIEPRQVNARALYFPHAIQSPKEITLSAEQMTAISNILGAGETSAHLLYGITGSGKTEVYIEVIRHYLKTGNSTILLIPEIALTPQMVERFFHAFGDILAIMHSQLTDRERYEQWQRIRNGQCRIVIGARSAVFAPVQNLGLIIVDEEHEATYKQDSTPRYHGRDTAIVRARLESARIILGSATPALESYNNALSGRFQLHKLLYRPLNSRPAQVRLVDLRDEPERDLLSTPLKDAITDRLSKGEQIILFQNRRGFASFVQCLKCGFLLQCPNCEISLYYHRDHDQLNCHYCDYKAQLPRKCPKCGSYSFAYGAPGTQKVEQLIQIFFPTAKVMRLDSDSSGKKDIYQIMYDRMKSREIDILLGTQMISKGLDFPNVTLVGVILADVSLNVPDFRASERTFQLLTQVVGRSGRGEKSGQAIIQAYNPQHYAIQYALRQDYESFADEELSYRRRLCYPPFYRLARILFQHKDEAALKRLITDNHGIFTRTPDLFQPGQLLLLGPIPSPLPRINNLFRYQVVIKAANVEIMSSAVQFLMRSLKLPTTVQTTVDIDPTMLM